MAKEIAERLRELGFDPYVAVEEQSLRGLKENIFEQLRKSEYFIFVDFKRELLAETNSLTHRGSLFSHQELAIASFLDMPVLALQEEGVKKDDGILRFLQANAIPFIDRHLLYNFVADKVRERRWDPNWRNELVFERLPGQFSDAQIVNFNNKLGRYFHIDVRNRHRDRTATNCYVYLEKVTQLDAGKEISVRPIEFKWAGYQLPSVHIPPGHARTFDAFHLLHDAPTMLQFNMFADSTEFIPRVEGIGRYEFKYLVVADNFPESRGSFIVNLSRTLAHTTLDPTSPTQAAES